jgi:predicted nucleic acid-binding protein
MIAIDTNVLVRLLLADDPAQTRRARALAESDRLFVSVTVLLETEWVLRALYRIPDADIRSGFRTLLGAVDVEDRTGVERALERAANGLDFADALHVARAGQTAAFATFDTKLLKRAKKLGVQPPVRQP